MLILQKRLLLLCLWIRCIWPCSLSSFSRALSHTVAVSWNCDPLENCVIYWEIHLRMIHSRDVGTISDLGNDTRGHFFPSKKKRVFSKTKGHFFVYCKILGAPAPNAPRPVPAPMMIREIVLFHWPLQCLQRTRGECEANRFYNIG